VTAADHAGDPAAHPGRVASPVWLFWSAACLAIIFVGVKALYLAARVDPGAGNSSSNLRSLAAITYRDITFVLATWAIARAAIAAVPVRAVQRVVVAGFILFATVVALYAIASVIAFGILGGFLTYALLELVGNVRMIESSVEAYLTPRVAFGLIGIPSLYLALVALTVSLRRRIAPRRWIGRAAVPAIAIAWIIAGQRTFVAEWSTHYDWRIADNAPWVLASTWWQAMTAGERIVRMSDQFVAQDLADFEPIGQRAEPLRIPPPPRRRAAATRQPRRQPNVILLVLESVALRWTTFGGRYDTTPTLKTEAAQATVFDNLYAHVGRSSNSLAAILLSVYPRLDFRDFTEAYPRVQRTSLASVFRDRGYRTAFLTPSDLSWAGWEVFLQSRGFDEVRDYRGMACSEQISSWGVEDRCLVDALVEFIGRNPDTPFFAMAWTQQTHHPYEPSPGAPMFDFLHDREPVPDDYDLERYLNVLHGTDQALARMFAAIRAAGLADDTLVVVVGDHGQAFGYPHDSYLQGRTAYEEDVHVPMLVWSPRRYRSETHVPVIGGHVDLAPTIAELTGVPPAPDWQGRNLFDPSHPPRAYFYVAQDEFKLGIREGDWKYIFDLRSGTDELYNLATDPDEQHRVTGEDARAARLRQRLAAWAEANRRHYTKPDAR
jgi:phosphoglycerol transferase MdoB-like AlkP superfamily enzyme